MDGTFTTTDFDGSQRSSAAVVNNFKHLSSETACKPTSNSAQWDDTLACDSSVKVASVRFSQLQSGIFDLVGMKAEEIPDITANVS